jgi:hypothetical protein
VIWSLEWRIALRSRRLFAFNVLVPLLLVVPVAFGGAPRQHAAMVYALLIMFFGTFGGAIPLVRDAEKGLLARVARTGTSRYALVLERVLANATIDLVQLAPSIAAIVIADASTPAATLALLAAAACALVAANAIGVWTAAFGRSIAEAALFSAVVALLAAHFSGVFRIPAPGSFGDIVQPLLPFTWLHAAARVATNLGPGAPLDAAFAMNTGPAMATVADGRLTNVVLAAAVTAAAVLCLTVLAAARLTRRLERTPD